MIYKTYNTFLSKTFRQSTHQSSHSKQQNTASSPFIVPSRHFDSKKLSKSLYQLKRTIQQTRLKNQYLASEILFSNGKQQTRKFLNKTKQLFGNKNKALKRKPLQMTKDCPKQPQVKRPKTSKNFYLTQKYHNCNSLYFQKFQPDFTIRSSYDPPILAQQRHTLYGLQQADLENYERKRRGLSSRTKRNYKLKPKKDFRKLNMHGFVNKIATNLQTKRRISVKSLAKMIGLNLQNVRNNFYIEKVR